MEISPQLSPSGETSQTVFGGLTWSRLEQVLCSQSRNIEDQTLVSRLLSVARRSSIGWSEAELCVELVAITAIALQPEWRASHLLCGDWAPGSWMESQTMT